MKSASASSTHPFDRLTPDVVLDALASVELIGDGRLQALSSYENRVYQVHLEEGLAVVAKFYRPARWSDAQILEEHGFAADLMAAEVPVIGPLRLGGATPTTSRALPFQSALDVAVAHQNLTTRMCWSGQADSWRACIW